MPQNPDIQYLRIRQVEGGVSPLLLDDLDTEANKKQPHQIPVYVPISGSVDLPLNDQVLLSYNQGTIRGFINSGRVQAQVVADDGSATVWVSPDGDDDNSGTRSAPFASIQYAIDTLVERVGHETYKTVRIMSGQYVETVIVYTRNIKICADVPNTRLISELNVQSADHHLGVDSVEPAFFITNGTKEAALAFIAEGGFTFEVESDVYTYTGASRTERELAYGSESDSARANVTLEDLNTWDFGGLIWVVHMSDEPSSPEGRIVHVQFNNMLSAPLRVLHAIDISMPDSRFDSLPDSIIGPCVLHNCGFIGPTASKTVARSASPFFLWDDSDALVYSDDISVFRRGFLNHKSVDWVAERNTTAAGTGGGIKLLGHIRLSDWDVSTSGIRIGGDITLITETSPPETAPPARIVECVNFILRNGAGAHIKELSVEGIEHESTGSLRVQVLKCSGDCSVGNGHFKSGPGVIKGNLTVSDGASIDFTGVTVLGNVDLTGAGSVTWRGGSYYGSLDDPDTKMDGTSPGDYLNVTP